MPLDPNIALSVKPTPFNNPFEVLAQMQHLKAQAQVINSNQALEEQRRARIKQDEDEEKRKTAVAQAITDIKAGNHEAVLANLDPQSRLLAEEWLTKDADTKRQRAVLQRKDLQDRAQLIRAFDYNPAIAEIQFGLIADDFPEASKSWEDVKGDPAKLRALVDRVADIDAKPPAAPEGFSLSPGQSRFDPTGKQIATVPATAAPSSAPQDFTLTPGGVRFDASGKQIAAVPAAEKVASEPGSIDAAIAAARNDPMELNRLLAIKRQMAEATREPKTAPTASEAGWSIQQASDPSTNTTKMMRVNSRTGEVQEIKLPGDMQAGGQRQTRLTAAQQEDLATMATVQDLSKNISDLGEKIGWSGVGGMYTGTVSQFLSKQFGAGKPEAVSLRALIGNVRGTIAKLRGGTSFTANEQKLLDTYTPGIDESVQDIKAKLAGLNDFIETKRKNTMQFAGVDTKTAPKEQAKPNPIKILKIEEVR